MVDITPEMARVELARRELERRGSSEGILGAEKDAVKDLSHHVKNWWAGDSEEEGPESSISEKYLDYLKGAFSGMGQRGAEAGRAIPQGIFNLYGHATGTEPYQSPKPDVEGFAPETPWGQTGKKVGRAEADLFSKGLRGGAAKQMTRALNRYVPFTKGAERRSYQPLQTAESEGVPFNASRGLTQEVNELLSHPALQAEGQTGKALTPHGKRSGGKRLVARKISVWALCPISAGRPRANCWQARRARPSFLSYTTSERPPYTNYDGRDGGRRVARRGRELQGSTRRLKKTP